MGYTHYWSAAHGAISDALFDALANDVETLARVARCNYSIPSELDIVRGEGFRGLTLNGVGADAYEPFGFGRDFCKTGMDRVRPYDRIVCASLIAMKRRLGDDIRIWSDEIEDSAELWLGARRLFREAFGGEWDPPLHQFIVDNAPMGVCIEIGLAEGSLTERGGRYFTLEPKSARSREEMLDAVLGR